MITCEIKDCSIAKNKCKECPFSSDCDYVWIGEIWKKNAKNLTPFNPMYVILSPNSAFVGNKLSLDITYTTKWYLGGREVMDKVNFNN